MRKKFLVRTSNSLFNKEKTLGGGMWRRDVFKVLPLVSNKVLLVEPGP